MHRSRFIAFRLTIVFVLCANVFSQTPLNSLFTYQGVLKSGGAPFTGNADFQFTLWDQLVGGSISGTYTATAVSVNAGLVTVPIDLGSADFNGITRYLQVAVRTPPGSGAYTTLTPRQKISPTPYSLFSIRTRGIYSTVDGQFVGIGTLAPETSLHIRGGMQEGLRIDGHTTGAAGLGFISFRDYAGIRTGYVGDASASDTATFLASDNGDVVLTTLAGRAVNVKPNGNVGIGTTNPNKRLTVAGSMEIGTSGGDYQHLRIGGGNSSGFLYGSFPHFADGIHLGYNYYADGAGANQIINSNGGTSRLTLGYGFATVATAPAFGGEPIARMVVTQDGDVGIGTAAPGNRLHVLGTVEGEVGLFTGVLGTTTGTLGSGTSTGVTGIALSSSGGAVGVKGQGNSASGFDFYAVGAGVNYGAPSSIRWKRNIELITDPLQKIEHMRGVTFDWDDEHGGQRDVGFIGEEVGQVLPEVVAYELDKPFVTGMDYSKVTPLLVEALKALRAEKDAQIAALQAQYKRLQDDHQEMRRRLDRLEKALAGVGGNW